jgi:hypothetical protein
MQQIQFEVGHPYPHSPNSSNAWRHINRRKMKRVCEDHSCVPKRFVYGHKTNNRLSDLGSRADLGDAADPYWRPHEFFASNFTCKNSGFAVLSRT